MNFVCSLIEFSTNKMLCMCHQADNSIIVNGNANANNNATITLNGNVVVNAKSNKLGLSSEICSGNITSKQSERNDHLRKDYKGQDVGTISDVVSTGNRQKSTKENIHEFADVKTDISDTISGEFVISN